MIIIIEEYCVGCCFNLPYKFFKFKYTMTNPTTKIIDIV